MDNKHYWHCVVCNVKSDNKLCWDCYHKLSQPCTICGKPTPTITRIGKPARNTTCVACTSHLNADAHRIGITCVICKQRFQSCLPANRKSVCDNCLSTTIPCPYCKKPMLKYLAKGRERKACGGSHCHPLPKASPAYKEAIRRRYANHVYKSHENKIARGKSEYTEWRKHVFERDGFTCQDCSAHSGNGTAIILHPHHIKPFATNPELRYDLSNGITLCFACHRKQHQHVFIGRTRKRPSGQLSLPTF